MTKQAPAVVRLVSRLQRALISVLPVVVAVSACQRRAETASAAPRATPITIALEALIEESRVRGPSASGNYQAPSDSARAKLRLSAALIARGGPQELPASFVAYACGSHRDIVTLRGSEPGSGIYALRIGEASPLLVLVPHSFWDTGTLPIGESLFEGLRARALFVNTLHRYKGAGCEPPGSDEDAPAPKACPSDMAHAADSYFEAVHEGLSSSFPSAITLALHGFSRGPGDPDLIVSAARTRTDLTPLMRELAALYGEDRVRSFPAQIQRLGGITSVQARLLRQMDGRMVHLEMSRELRDRLARDPAERTRLVQALSRWLGIEPAAPQHGTDAPSTSCVDEVRNPVAH